MIIFLALAIFVENSSAHAFEVSEEMLNQYVQHKIAEKTGRDIQVGKAPLGS